MMAIMQTTSSKESQSDGPEVFEKMSSFHPNEPHWYLPILGVDRFTMVKDLDLHSWNTQPLYWTKRIPWRILNLQMNETFHFTNDMGSNCLVYPSKYLTFYLSNDSKAKVLIVREETNLHFDELSNDPIQYY